MPGWPPAVTSGTAPRRSRSRGSGAQYWIAFRTTPGESRTGTYVGNAVDGRWITGLGFTPSGRIYVGGATVTGTGTVYSVDAATGLPDRSFFHGDGQVKGFVFPDRGSDAVYFSTDNLVWALSDRLSGFIENFPSGGLALLDGAKPSALLFGPGSHYLYVGGSNGRLYEIDVITATQKWVQLGDGTAVVGAPSLDRGYVPNVVHVGTEAGVFYAIEVPLP